MHLILTGYKVDDRTSYKIDDFKPCCYTMAHNNYIELAEDYITGEHPCICFINHKSDYSYGEYSRWEEPSQIIYCPYCGEKINIEISLIVDANKKYKSLNEEQCLLAEKARMTDSKIKETEFRKEMREISNNINWLLTSDKLQNME